ncbi:hypothetical protein J6590_022300 [Homalodisca vitripennis]|nr:hypothetical protein J6590_022300 [Homalodisca vitripennis]
MCSHSLSTLSPRHIHQQMYVPQRLIPSLACYRGMFEPIYPQTEAAVAHPSAQYNIPHVRLSACVRRLLLPQRGHLLHRQDRRVAALQLRVKTMEYSSGRVTRVDSEPRRGGRWTLMIAASDARARTGAPPLNHTVTFTFPVFDTFRHTEHGTYTCLVA